MQCQTLAHKAPATYQYVMSRSGRGTLGVKSLTRISSYSGALSKKAPDYRKLGEREAADHRPPSSSPYPDSHEVTLRSEAEGLTANEQHIFDALVAEADKSVLDVQGRIIELKADIQQALADNTLSSQLDAELASDRGKLVDVTAMRIRREVDWRSFRAQNDISEMAHYPESIIWHWAIVGVFALAEMLINAVFYENANGLAGGFMVAFSVAVVNMGLAAVLGSLFRRKNLSALDQKIGGWLCLVLFVPITLFCNALFAAFRSSYQVLTDPSDPLQLRDGFQQAWAEATNLFLAQFQFQDLSSFLLFMVGLALSFGAFWKGFTSDDPYPGYSKRDRALKAAKVEEQAAQAKVKQKLKNFLHDRRSHIQGLSGQTSSLITMLSNRLSEVERAQRSAFANAAAIQRDYHLVLDGYRQANLAIRGTEPPVYFTEKPSTADALSVEAAGPLANEIKQELANLEILQAKHRDELNDKQIVLQAQMSETLSSAFEAYIRNIEEDAKNAVERDIQVMPVTPA